MAITVTARHSALGAEIRGVDLRRSLDAATVQAVNDAWMAHLVVVFPDQPITDQEHDQPVNPELAAELTELVDEVEWPAWQFGW